MSRTLIPGVVGPSYWAYTSLVMKRRLEHIIRNGAIKGDEIPEGVYDSACEFFDLVGEAVNYQTAQNLVASNNAYLIALKALPARKTSHSPEVLQRHREVLRTLKTEAPMLAAEQLAEVMDLKQFFAGLRDLGTADRYVKTVQDDPVGAGLI